jgi:hypothetical protein
MPWQVSRYVQAKRKGELAHCGKLMLVLASRPLTCSTMDKSLAKQRVEQFHAKHGAECYELDGWLWYPNGARREVDLMGALVEPEDIRVSMTPDRLQYDLAIAKLKFYQAKLATAVRQFTDLQEHLYFFPPADANEEAAAIKKVEALKKVVEARNEEVRNAQAVVDATTFGQRLKLGRNRPQADTARVTNFRSRLKSIRV